MYLQNNVHLINMWKKMYNFNNHSLLKGRLRKSASLMPKVNFFNLGEYYIGTVNIKVVDNISHYNLSEIIYF
jgi:hypothetical protein